MTRHNSDRTVVVPVATRPVAWGNAPFVDLQGTDPKSQLSEGREDQKLGKLVSDLSSLILRRWHTGGSYNPAAAPPSRQPPPAPSRPFPELLLYLCDGSEQEASLREWIASCKEARRRPYFLLAHGAREERHDAFLSRLQHVTFPRRFEMETKPVTKVELEWPMYSTGSGSPEAIFGSRLADSLKLAPWTPMTDIHTFVLGMPGMSMFTAELDSASKNANTPKLIQKFLTLWDQWPEVTAGRVLTICLDVKYDAGNRGMRKLVTELKYDDYKNLHCLTLPALRAVPRHECELFFTHQYVKDDVDPSRRSEWEEEVDQLYDGPRREAIPMNVLISQLKEILPRYAR